MLPQRRLWLHVPGTLLFGAGALHTAFGLTTPVLRDPLLDILRDGVVQAVELVPDLPLSDRSTSFWFVGTGAMMCVAGAALRACAIASMRADALESHISSNMNATSGSINNNISSSSSNLSNSNNALISTSDGAYGTTAEIGWGLVAIGAVGVLCIPYSAFWLVVAEGVYIVWLVNNSGGSGGNISSRRIGASPTMRRGRSPKRYDPFD